MARDLAALRTQLLRFAAVGTAGFLVDEGILALLHQGLGLPASLSRVASIFVAMIFTWWGNRNLTFREHKASGTRAILFEFLRFAAASSVSAVCNYSVFLLLLNVSPPPLNNPYLAAMAGVGVSMVITFTSARFLVFAKTAAPAAPPAVRLAKAPPAAGKPD